MKKSRITQEHLDAVHKYANAGMVYSQAKAFDPIISSISMATFHRLRSANTLEDYKQIFNNYPSSHKDKSLQGKTSRGHTVTEEIYAKAKQAQALNINYINAYKLGLFPLSKATYALIGKTKTFADYVNLRNEMVKSFHKAKEERKAASITKATPSIASPTQENGRTIPQQLDSIEKQVQEINNNITIRLNQMEESIRNFSENKPFWRK